MKTSSIGIYVLVLLAMIFWGMSFVWSTIVFEYYKPVTTVFIRLVLSSAILWLIARLLRKSWPIRREHYKLFALSALFNPFFYFIGENFGLKLTSPTVSAVIIATIPLFTPIVGVMLLKEKLNRLNYLGMIISFAGIMVMLVTPNLTLIAPPLGVLFLAGAVLAAVIYSVMLMKLSANYSALTIITTQNIIGAIYFLPLFLVMDLKHFLSVVPDLRLLLALLQLAVFASSLAFVFYTTVIKQLGISRTNVFSNLIPVFTAIFSYFILGEIIGFNKIAGILLVVGGVALSQLNSGLSITGVYRFLFFNKPKNS